MVRAAALAGLWAGVSRAGSLPLTAPWPHFGIVPPPLLEVVVGDEDEVVLVLVGVPVGAEPPRRLMTEV